MILNNDNVFNDGDEEEEDNKVIATAMIMHDYNNGGNNINNDIQFMFTMVNLVPRVFHLPSPKGIRVMKISWEQGYTMAVWFTELVG